MPTYHSPLNHPATPPVSAVASHLTLKSPYRPDCESHNEGSEAANRGGLFMAGLIGSNILLQNQVDADNPMDMRQAEKPG